MSWRDKLKESEPPGDRPTLEAILDHYAIEYTTRTSSMIRCPLHEDRNPSCSIHLDKQVWKCHSCGEGGAAWELIMKKEGTNFDGARQYATAHGLAAGGSRGRGEELLIDSGSGRTRSVGSQGSRDNSSVRPYAPSWRRRDP